ncbi:MAG: hypothetical protein J3K34DRAFT_489422 [Monoraphidium minutum]|nr:MAG: hypothetical protein J3K34DRAFT_489422 [Monoraphidium minutum]
MGQCISLPDDALAARAGGATVDAGDALKTAATRKRPRKSAGAPPSSQARLIALLNGRDSAAGASAAVTAAPGTGKAAAAGAPAAPAAGAGLPALHRFALWRSRLHDSAASLAGRRRARGARRRGAAAPAPAPPPPPAAPQRGRAALRDLATGDLIPDFGVDGVFDVLQLLGSGGTAHTYLCRDLATRELVAAKFMERPLPKLAVPLLMREVDLQARLGQGHPNLVQVQELVLTDSHLALVLEFAAGGTLTDLVAGRWESALERGGLHLSEPEARYYFRQDLKLDNTLLDGSLAAPRIKLCDFGFARQWGADGSGGMLTALGTPAYMSPQILSAKYGAQGFDGRASDVWAMGVMLFVSLFGCFPFEHDKHKDPNCEEAFLEDPNCEEAFLEVRMAQEKLSWRDNPCAAAAIKRGALSPEVANLLDRLLAKDEAKRIQIEAICAHPWLAAPLEDPVHTEAWELLLAEAEERRAATQQPRAAAQLKKLKNAMLAMMAAATRTAADAPLFGGDALTAAAAATAPPAAAPAAGGGGAPRRWRRLRHESMPTVANIRGAQPHAPGSPIVARVGSVTDVPGGSGGGAAAAAGVAAAGAGAGSGARGMTHRLSLEGAGFALGGGAALRALAVDGRCSGEHPGSPTGEQVRNPGPPDDGGGGGGGAGAEVRSSYDAQASRLTALAAAVAAATAAAADARAAAAAAAAAAARAAAAASAAGGAAPAAAAAAAGDDAAAALDRIIAATSAVPAATVATAAGGGGCGPGSPAAAARGGGALLGGRGGGGADVDDVRAAALPACSSWPTAAAPRAGSGGGGGAPPAAADAPLASADDAPLASADAPPVAPPAAAPLMPPWGIQDARGVGGGLVWRLPLVVWAPDEALRVPLPELSVAAGALIKQLQSGHAGNKPRLAALCKRMSWPLAPGAAVNAGCGESAIAGL